MAKAGSQDDLHKMVNITRGTATILCSIGAPGTQMVCNAN